MLKRAFSKLRLEHVVIGKGQFQQEKVKSTVSDALEVCVHFNELLLQLVLLWFLF